MFVMTMILFKSERQNHTRTGPCLLVWAKSCSKTQKVLLKKHLSWGSTWQQFKKIFYNYERVNYI